MCVNLQLKIKYLYLMRRFFGPTCLLLFAVFLLTSCLKNDNDEVTLYNDTAITSFQITSAKIYKHTTSSTGADSVYVTTNTSMSEYTFYIDQEKGLIYNADSLPVGTDAAKLLCSYATKNNGYVLIQNVKGDSVKYLSATDTTDFTLPRKLEVISSDGTARRDYIVKVNVHKEQADSFVWKSQAFNPGLAAMTRMKAVTLGNRIVVLGSNGEGTYAYTSADNDGKTWAKADITMGADSYNSAAVMGSTLYVLDNGMLKASADGMTFNDICAAPACKQLVGASKTELYAIGTDGRMLVSADQGHTWNADKLDDSADLLPATDWASACTTFAYADSTDYMLLAGSRSVTSYPADRNATVWSKIVEYTAFKEQTPWSYITFDDRSYYPLPRLSSLVILPYDKKFLAFGGQGIGACDNAAYSGIYESCDGGLTWKASETYVFPATFDKAVPAVAATVDKDNHIWLICGQSGQVWRGQLNRMGWSQSR